MSEDRPIHEVMAQDLIEQKVRDMKARGDLLVMEGQALIAKGETIRYEALILEDDLYKFKRNHRNEFSEE